jgi:hypothetical protein
MPLQFHESLNVTPLPVDQLTAGVLGRAFAARITAAGGRDNAARAAADAIIARRADEAPSEVGRLQRLFAQVYTRAEIERLMLNTFDSLGLTP